MDSMKTDTEKRFLLAANVSTKQLPALNLPLPQMDTRQKLRIYALYKYATQGTCNTAKPAFYDAINRAKWDAWNSIPKQMHQDDARIEYVEEVCSYLTACQQQLDPESVQINEWLQALQDVDDQVDGTTSGEESDVNSFYHDSTSVNNDLKHVVIESYQDETSIEFRLEKLERELKPILTALKWLRVSPPKNLLRVIRLIMLILLIVLIRRRGGIMESLRWVFK